MGAESSASHYSKIFHDTNTIFTQLQFGKQMKQLPIGNYDILKPIKVNQTELLLPSSSMKFGLGNGARDKQGLWLFNVVTQKCELIIKYDVKIAGKGSQAAAATFDSNTNDIYLLFAPRSLTWTADEKKSKLVKVNLERKKHILLSDNVRYFGLFPSMIFVNNVLHLIGGSDNTSHFIWNFGKNELEHVHTFDQWGKGKGCSGLLLIHLKKASKLMIFGGCNHGAAKPELRMDNILEYDIDKRSWKEFDIKLPFKGHNFVYGLTRNETHLIINYFGTSDIVTLDMTTMEFKTSRIKLPCDSNLFNKGIVMELCEKKDILIAGYIRNTVMKEEFPNDITRFISSMLATEYMYIFQRLPRKLPEISTNIPFNISVASLFQYPI